MSGDDATANVGQPPASVGDVPSAIDRYRIVRRLGAGGMGVVYEGLDPKLERAVAIKVVRAEGRDAAATARLVREANALAQLSHPNVVPVYDVGATGEQVFIVMELVSGGTLGAWLRDGARDWPEVVAVFRQAALGLAAAHAVSLVHRDFKPDNVMIDEAEKRARVMDFGLARAERTLDEPTPMRSSVSGPSDRLETPLTHANTVMGTPAFMAPEQHAGGSIDARSDQYAFCVALHQALYGNRPFAGRDQRALYEAKMVGVVPPPSHGSRVPSWLRAIVLRGLRPDPDARWPSMDALIAALDEGPRSQRRRMQLAALACVAIIAGLAFVLSPPPRTDCAALADLRGAWDDPVRARARQAFDATGLPYAAMAFERSAPWLDEQARTWVQMKTEACETATDDAALADRRALCLDQRIAELRALAELFANADAKVVEAAVQKSSRLVPVAVCADDEGLRSGLPPPDASVRAEVIALRDELAKASAKLRTASADVASGEALVARAAATGYAPVHAEALFVLGEQLDSEAAYARAETVYADAYHTAVACGNDRTAVLAAQRMVFMLGYSNARYDDALRWGEHGRAIVERSFVGEYNDAALRQSIASVHQERGSYDAALPEYARAIEIFEDVRGVDHPDTGLALNGRGDLLRRMGRFTEAAADFERGIEIIRTAYGPDHPRLIGPTTNLGMVLRLQNEPEAAEPYLVRAIELVELSYGPDHPNLAMALGNYSNLFWDRGDYTRMHELAMRAASIFEKSLGPEHPNFATALDNAGVALVWLERYDEARPLQERALAIRRQAYGTDHPEIARSLSGIGLAASRRGRYEEALARHREAFALLERTVGPDHPDAAPAKLGIAEALTKLDRGAEAKPLYTELARACDNPGQLPDRLCSDVRAAM